MPESRQPKDPVNFC